MAVPPASALTRRCCTTELAGRGTHLPCEAACGHRARGRVRAHDGPGCLGGDPGRQRAGRQSEVRRASAGCALQSAIGAKAHMQGFWWRLAHLYWRLLPACCTCRRVAQSQVDSAASSLQLTIQKAMLPVEQVGDWVRHTRNFTTVNKDWADRVGDWWIPVRRCEWRCHAAVAWHVAQVPMVLPLSCRCGIGWARPVPAGTCVQAAETGMVISLAPQGRVTNVWPDVPANQGLVGLDILDFPPIRGMVSPTVGAPQPARASLVPRRMTHAGAAPCPSRCRSSRAWRRSASPWHVSARPTQTLSLHATEGRAA